MGSLSCQEEEKRKEPVHMLQHKRKIRIVVVGDGATGKTTFIKEAIRGSSIQPMT